MQNKHLFKLLLVLFLVLGLGLSSASADLVTLFVDDGPNLLLKGKFAVDSGIAYKVITIVKKDGNQIFKQVVTLGPGASKAKRTGPDFQYIAKLVIDPEGDKLIVRYEQSGVGFEGQYVGTVKVKVNDTGELAYLCKGTLGTPNEVQDCFNPSDYGEDEFVPACEEIAGCNEDILPCSEIVEEENCQLCITEDDEDYCNECAAFMSSAEHGQCTNVCQ